MKENYKNVLKLIQALFKVTWLYVFEFGIPLLVQETCGTRIKVAQSRNNLNCKKGQNLENYKIAIFFFRLSLPELVWLKILSAYILWKNAWGPRQAKWGQKNYQEEVKKL